MRAKVRGPGYPRCGVLLRARAGALGTLASGAADPVRHAAASVCALPARYWAPLRAGTAPLLLPSGSMKVHIHLHDTQEFIARMSMLRLIGPLHRMARSRLLLPHGMVVVRVVLQTLHQLQNPGLLEVLNHAGTDWCQPDQHQPVLTRSRRSVSPQASCDSDHKFIPRRARISGWPSPAVNHKRKMVTCTDRRKEKIG